MMPKKKLKLYIQKNIQLYFYQYEVIKFHTLFCMNIKTTDFVIFYARYVSCFFASVYISVISSGSFYVVSMLPET